MAESVAAPAAAKDTAASAPAADGYFDAFDFGKLELTLDTLLRAGVHFGHLKSRRHPKMDEFVFTTRKNINIINLEKTAAQLESAADFLRSVARAGKPILFVGMSKQTHDPVKSLAIRIGMPYVIDRWLGGTLTNFNCIRERGRYLKDGQAKFESGEYKMYTKFEQSRKMEELEKLEKKVGGIKHMDELPGAIVVADAKEAELVLREAEKMHVPVVAIVDTNTDPSLVAYPIPGNDDALSSLRLLLGYLGKVVLETKEVVAKEKEKAKMGA